MIKLNALDFERDICVITTSLVYLNNDLLLGLFALLLVSIQGCTNLYLLTTICKLIDHLTS